MDEPDKVDCRRVLVGMSIGRWMHTLGVFK